MNMRERYEHDKEMATDLRIRALRIKALEHRMEYYLDPFSKEFEQAADKLRELRKEQREAGAARDKFRRQTRHLEAKHNGGVDSMGNIHRDIIEDQKRQREAEEAAEEARDRILQQADEDNIRSYEAAEAEGDTEYCAAFRDGYRETKAFLNATAYSDNPIE